MQTSTWEARCAMAHQMLAYVQGRTFEEGKARLISTLEQQVEASKQVTLEDFNKATGSEISE